jgi:SAM-dependent methyltransferase
LRLRSLYCGEKACLGGCNPLEMNLAKSVLVVAPRCPATLIQELLGGGVLPPQTHFDVLLPPGDLRPYGKLMADQNQTLTARFLPPPSRHFFSPRHLYWLWKSLRSAQGTLLLVADSPYQNRAAALLVLTVLALAGKGIVLLFANPEGDTDLAGQGSSERWLSRELNLRILVKELARLIGSLKLCNYFEVQPPEPANLRPLDASPENIEQDVDYALATADFWIYSLPGGEASLKGKRVLEIGPGVNFGAILTLACYGAEVTAVERFSSPWNQDYHPRFYARLRDKLAERGSLMDLTPLDMILSQRRYPQDSISIYNCSLEKLKGVPEQSIDFIFSNAVFEHLYDLKAAFAHLARITRPGGFGLHQVDFRDHRDLSRPLEHLLLSDREFSRVFNEENSECGNRFRPGEMRRLLESVGFEITDFLPNLDVEEGYLKEFLERLRQAKKSRYCNYRAEDLRCASAIFIVGRKPG